MWCKWTLCKRRERRRDLSFCFCPIKLDLCQLFAPPLFFRLLFRLNYVQNRHNYFSLNFSFITSSYSVIWIIQFNLPRDIKDLKIICFATRWWHTLETYILVVMGRPRSGFHLILVSSFNLFHHTSDPVADFSIG